MKTLELRWSFLSYLFLSAPGFCFGCLVSRKPQFLKISKICWWWHCCHLLTAHLAASKTFHLNRKGKTSLVVQWLRNCLPMQAWLRSLVPGPGTKIPLAAGEPSPWAITKGEKKACVLQQRLGAAKNKQTESTRFIPRFVGELTSLSHLLSCSSILPKI